MGKLYTSEYPQTSFYLKKKKIKIQFPKLSNQALNELYNPGRVIEGYDPSNSAFPVAGIACLYP